jgi:hypothetical protein
LEKLEAALPATDSATATFGFEGAASASAAVRIESATTTRLAREARSTFSGFVDSQFSAGQISAVQGFYGLGGVLVIFELDEGESPWASRHPVHRHRDIGNGADGTEKLD